MRVLMLVAAVLVLNACSQNAATDPAAAAGTECADPRPQVCTMEYNPTCATLVAGGIKEYASGCNACADDAVASYVPGACPVSE